jgi:hypothetical protein
MSEYLESTDKPLHQIYSKRKIEVFYDLWKTSGIPLRTWCRIHHLPYPYISHRFYLLERRKKKKAEEMIRLGRLAFSVMCEQLAKEGMKNGDSHSRS